MLFYHAYFDCRTVFPELIFNHVCVEVSKIHMVTGGIVRLLLISQVIVVHVTFFNLSIVIEATVLHWDPSDLDRIVGSTHFCVFFPTWASRF